jgi:hypothetical protein
MLLSISLKFRKNPTNSPHIAREIAIVAVVTINIERLLLIFWSASEIKCTNHLR